MKALYLDGVGLMAPGLAGWEPSLPILSGARRYREESLPALKSNLLPANERRRTTQVIDIALYVAQEAMVQAGLENRQIRSVFASSEGDGEIIHKICSALTLQPISPTLFHNSVHNAPAGYWAIGTGCTLPSITLSVYDDSFSAGLLEAATLAEVESARVLLVVYDVPFPFPLSEKRRIHGPFATALLLSPERTPGSRGKLALRLASDGPEERLDERGLEALRTGNPAARGLPLLRAIARGEARRVILPYLSGRSLVVGFEP